MWETIALAAVNKGASAASSKSGTSGDIGGGGFDASNWTVNYGDGASVSPVSYKSTPLGTFNPMLAPSLPSVGGGGNLSPYVMWGAIALIGAVAWKRLKK